MRENLKWFDENCACGKQINSWDKRLSKALGYKKTVVCETCIAKEYDITIDELREISEHHFGLIPCMGL